jgi:hypothetical protein
LLKDGRPGGHKEFQPYLEPLAGALQPVDQVSGLGRAGYIESYDEPFARLLHGVQFRRENGREGGIQPFRNRHI